MLEGETGTGKETVAKSLHAWSGRSGAFVSLSCPTLAEGPVEEAALLGSTSSSFERAAGGTLLLGGVSHLPASIRTKLLLSLRQEKERFDVRLVIAEEESLDEQLLVNLEAHTVRLPPLCQRREDVPGIFLGLLRSLAGREIEVDSDLIEKLCLHDWPFNVRELVLLTRFLFAAHGNEALLSEKHLPDRFSAIATDRSS